MKVAIFSDLHVHPFAEFANPMGLNVTDRLLDSVSVLKDVRKRCLEEGISVVLFGGDLFHRRGVVGVPAYGLVVNELVRWRKAGIEGIFLPGNHDQVDRAGTTDAVQALAKASLCRTVPAEGGSKTFRLGDVEVAAFSYCDGREELERRLDREEKEAGRGFRIGLFHHGFEGARVGTYLEYEVKEPISAKGVLGGRRFDVVLSGHYHGRQEIRGVRNGWYVGSPLEHVRGEQDEDKGFLIFDVSKGEIEVVPLRRPRFVSVCVDEADGWDDLFGNFVDVHGVDDGGREEVEDVLKDAGARGWKFVKEARPRPEDVAKVVDPKTPPNVALRRLLRERAEEIEGRGLDQKEVAEQGKLFLSAASEEK